MSKFLSFSNGFDPIEKKDVVYALGKDGVILGYFIKRRTKIRFEVDDRVYFYKDCWEGILVKFNELTDLGILHKQNPKGVGVKNGDTK